jgi:hypothetical protein
MMCKKRTTIPIILFGMFMQIIIMRRHSRCILLRKENKVKVKSILFVPVTIVLLSMFGCAHHYNDNFPRRLGIVKNDGDILELEVNTLKRGKNKYYVERYVNGKIHDDARLISVPVKLTYPISETGKYTFAFYTDDPKTNPISKIWEQDVFVSRMDPGGISQKTIDNLAMKYAPLVLLDGKEEYLPASIAYLQNWDDSLNLPIDDCNVNVTLKIPGIEKISFP